MKRLDPRDLAYCGLFGAAALLLPVLFHLVHLGHVFMPMYLPLVTLAFLVRPLPAATTAAITPVLSGAVTGMPPLYPPIAAFMGIELAFMAALIATVGPALAASQPMARADPGPAPRSSRPCRHGVRLCPDHHVASRISGRAFARERMAGPHLDGGCGSARGHTGTTVCSAHIREQRERRMNGNPRAAFFDAIADKWDGWECLSVASPEVCGWPRCHGREPR